MASTENIIAISVQNVSKTFRLPHEKHNSLKGLFLSGFKKRSFELQHALRNINFEVKKGEFFGIVGRNGSGKSTLLKCLAGVYTPSKGYIKINGKLVPFIELGVGFNPDLSGRDNVFLNGALLGFNRKQIEAMYNDIVEFAELQQFMDQKLKNYSSGMQVRLAFSIAIRAKGDILLLDEVLAVGDSLFQQKCFNYFHELKRDKKTVLFVSHDASALRQYCTSGILIENGEIVKQGSIDTVLDAYTQIINKREFEETEANSKLEKPTKRTGSGKVLLEKIIIKDDKHKEKGLFTEDDEKIIIKATFRAQTNVQSPVYGVTVKDVAGNNIFASNNIWTMKKSNDLGLNQKQTVTWTVPNFFKSGDYFITPAVADTYGKETYDKVDEMIRFKVSKKVTTSALANPDHRLEFTETTKSQ